MSGRLDKTQLEALVASGDVDTVVAAFTDMQGRLIGKRVTGRVFLDAVHEEWHACNYLLTVDMEMEPVPGFKAASWAKGYGDFVIKPDLGRRRAKAVLERLQQPIGHGHEGAKDHRQDRGDQDRGGPPPS